jgi:hypothetical protein
MSSAQSALTTLQSDMQTASAGYSPDSTSPASGVAGATAAAGSPKTDLDALFQAVKSGDMSGAQAALAQFKTDVQSTAQKAGAQQHHHHHHHHPSKPAAATGSTGSTTGTTGSDSDSSTPAVVS